MQKCSNFVQKQIVPGHWPDSIDHIITSPHIYSRPLRVLFVPGYMEPKEYAARDLTSRVSFLLGLPFSSLSYFNGAEAQAKSSCLREMVRNTSCVLRDPAWTHILVAHSIGATVAIKAALKVPEQSISGIVCMGPLVDENVGISPEGVSKYEEHMGLAPGKAKYTFRYASVVFQRLISSPLPWPVYVIGAVKDKRVPFVRLKKLIARSRASLALLESPGGHSFCGDLPIHPLSNALHAVAKSAVSSNVATL